MSFLSMFAGAQAATSVGPSQRKWKGTSTSPARNLSAESWSPTLAQLQHAFSEPGCPICHAQVTGLKEYLSWLSADLRKVGPASDVHSHAIWLCSAHTWGFVNECGSEVAGPLVMAKADYWRARLTDLYPELHREPSANVFRRLAAAARKDRAIRPPPFWRRYLSVPPGRCLSAALESPTRKLARLRDVAFRRAECPACHHLESVSHRMSALMVRALDDRNARGSYLQSSGVCLRHLPLVLSSCQSRPARTVIDAARVRLEILRWELDESLRKLNWSVRYESKGHEQTAWARAVEQAVGSLAWAELAGRAPL